MKTAHALLRAELRLLLGAAPTTVESFRLAREERVRELRALLKDAPDPESTTDEALDALLDRAKGGDAFDRRRR